MTSLADRRQLSQDIHVAWQSGARLIPACQIVGIALRTLQRWQADQGGPLGWLIAGRKRLAQRSAMS